MRRAGVVVLVVAWSLCSCRPDGGGSSSSGSGSGGGGDSSSSAASGVATSLGGSSGLATSDGVSSGEATSGLPPSSSSAATSSVPGSSSSVGGGSSSVDPSSGVLPSSTSHDGGTSHLPPVARCPEAGDNPVNGRPLDTLTLDCSASTDPGGTPLHLAWSVERLPAGSQAALQVRDGGVAATLLDLATPAASPYVFRCTASNGTQEDSCTVTARAQPAQALYVQLTWDTSLTDMDLHLRRQVADGGAWFGLPEDCHWANRTPAWGQAGSTADDPSLLVDDVSGHGPEATAIPNPSAGTYLVGVHAYCAFAQGATQATVRVFCNGGEAASLTRSLENTGDFWTVASVEWPGCRVRGLGQVEQVDVGCGETPSCSPSTCAGCCTVSGSCEPGTTDTTCGREGLACADCWWESAPTCAGPICTTSGRPDAGCTATTCPGCCDPAGRCLDGDRDDACGSLARLCQDCVASELACLDRGCAQPLPDAGPCGPATCNGCCAPGTGCQQGTADRACGLYGAACLDCGSSGRACQAGWCVSRDGGA